MAPYLLPAEQEVKPEQVGPEQGVKLEQVGPEQEVKPEQGATGAVAVSEVSGAS